MKSLFFIISVFILANVNAQNIGIGTTSPAASAMLDISSTTKGLLIPRMPTVPDKFFFEKYTYSFKQLLHVQ